MRFQCIMCFTIIRVSPKQRPATMNCPNCGNHLVVPKSRFERNCVIDDFVIDSLIGRGGMASVFLARQLSMDRPVALKILDSSYLTDDKYVMSFLKEAKAAARINHPNLVTSIAVGQEEGAVYYAMEYIEGMTLGQKLEQEKTLDADEALNIVQQCAEALHAAWTHEGLIHRDVKPDNIMLAKDGYAKVMDLGIAITNRESEHAEVSGTPAYMAPEQFSQRPLDCRTDIYALGCTLYNLLVGYTPFDGASPEEIGRKHLYNDVIFPDRNLTLIPNRVRRLISRMLAKDPNERFPNYDELLEEVVFIRRRLAPDASLVPSVHTISFSKYRMRDEVMAQETPSAVYRKRIHKERNLAIAQEKARQESARVPWPWYVKLSLVLLILLGLLVTGYVVVQHRNTPSAFARQVEERLLEVPLPVPANQVANISELVRENGKLLMQCPIDPSAGDRLAREELNTHTYRMRLQYINVQMDALDVLKRQLQEQLTLLKQERSSLAERLGAAETSLAEAREGQREAEAVLAEVTQDVQERSQRTDGLAAEVTQLTHERDALMKRVGDLEESSRVVLQGRLIELARSFQFSQAKRLLAPRPGTESAVARAWRDRQLEYLTVAERMVSSVVDSGTRFAGETIGDGRLTSITGDSMRLAVPVGEVTTYHERSLATLSPRELYALAAKAWTEPPPLAQAGYEYALTMGDFAMARELLPADSDPLVFSSMVRQLIEQQVGEAETLLRAGGFTQAAARAKLIGTWYGNLPEYKEFDDRLREVMRQVTARLTPPTRPPVTPPTTPSGTTPVPSSTTGTGAATTPLPE